MRRTLAFGNRVVVHVFDRYVAKLIRPVNQGMIDYILFPERRDPWGGPFNGQRMRQGLFLSLVYACRPVAIIETGTYLGDTTEFMANASKLPVYSVEADARTFGYAKMRLRKHCNVKLSLGDSCEFLKNFIASNGARYADLPVLFYLDAHWGKCLPLSDELTAILVSFSRAVVMIDDFQVPNDDGYVYDDYGVSGVLNRDYIGPQISKFKLAEFYPTTPSADETGAHRGCVVLARDQMLIDSLSRVSLLWKRAD